MDVYLHLESCGQSIPEGKEVAYDRQAEVEVVEGQVETLSSSDAGALVLHCVRGSDL